MTFVIGTSQFTSPQRRVGRERSLEPHRAQLSTAGVQNVPEHMCSDGRSAQFKEIFPTSINFGRQAIRQPTRGKTCSRRGAIAYGESSPSALEGADLLELTSVARRTFD
eukprot:TRINITY_DN76200_c0_g1_i1.p1 TRINITY_DN76200_c0_g1~~TRINITY_DN76200_c0_g1_i1.p1  ORF type:complete len:109 (-),score=0.39 TRINITY_DN76200_c0_g1_i1:8-334(-)